jgi:hypothetical protein
LLARQQKSQSAVFSAGKPTEDLFYDRYRRLSSLRTGVHGSPPNITHGRQQLHEIVGSDLEAGSTPGI